jgi:hypothetical protein
MPTLGRKAYAADANATPRGAARLGCNQTEERLAAAASFATRSLSAAQSQTRRAFGGEIAEQQAEAEQQHEASRAEFHAAHDQRAAALAAAA